MPSRILCLFLVFAGCLVARVQAQLRPGASGSGEPTTATAEEFRPSHIQAGASFFATQQPPQPAESVTPDSSTRRWHEPVEIALSLGVLVFGAALILLFTRALLRMGRDWRTIYLRLVILTVVVTAGLFALTAGYTEQQISPMMGLLGTLVGYLLGRESNTPAQGESNSPPAASAQPRT